LLKPTTRPRLRGALALRATVRGGRAFGDSGRACSNFLRNGRTPGPPAPDRCAQRRAGDVVATEDIDWIDGGGNYAVLHTGKETHILRETMSTLESELPANTFLR